MSWRHVAATVLLFGGAAVEVVAVLGMVVMRDSLDRLHYVGLAGFGALLVGVAIVVRESFSLVGDKSLATGFLLVTVGPVLVLTTGRTILARRHDGEWNADIERHREEPGA